MYQKKRIFKLFEASKFVPNQTAPIPRFLGHGVFTLKQLSCVGVKIGAVIFVIVNKNLDIKHVDFYALIFHLPLVVFLVSAHCTCFVI